MLCNTRNNSDDLTSLTAFLTCFSLKKDKISRLSTSCCNLLRRIYCICLRWACVLCAHWLMQRDLSELESMRVVVGRCVHVCPQQRFLILVTSSIRGMQWIIRLTKASPSAFTPPPPFSSEQQDFIRQAGPLIEAVERFGVMKCGSSEQSLIHGDEQESKPSVTFQLTLNTPFQFTQ